MKLDNAGDAANRVIPPGFAALGDRRQFLKWSGAAAVLLAACDSGPTDSSPPTPSYGVAKGGITDGAAAVTIDLSNDIGILNFAYALEQLEAAFYTMVVANQFTGGGAEEVQVFSDIKKHEVIHREFFRTALGSAAIPGLSFDFSSINFRSRGGVLGVALAFEELGVSAYNGAAQFISNTDYLVIAGKIVSVEARHASTIADLFRPNGKSFAPRAFDLARGFNEVLAIADPYIATAVTLTNVPS
ncbi:MAG: ferritin-like domain-containing protein [Gemmatimonadales bacterium]|nr:ferritin-like domain-containing protein [Gemmatimonadales bacterium]